MTRPPRWVFIAQYSQTDHRLPVPVIDAIVVNKHPLGEPGVALVLDFDMDEDPRFLAVLEPHLEELVGKTKTEIRLAYDLLQLFVERFVV